MANGLGTSGQLIWSAFEADTRDAGAQTLIREFARCADTLDRLDGLASGRQEEWATLVFDDMGEVHLSVDKILDERRTHQLALKALYAEMRMAGIKAQASQGGKKDEEPQDMLASLRQKKAERESQSG